MSLSHIKHYHMTARLIEDAIRWWIAENNPQILDDDLADFQDDPVNQEEAIKDIITYLLEDYEL